MGAPPTMDESISSNVRGGSSKKQGKLHLPIKCTKRGVVRGAKKRRKLKPNQVKFSILGSNSAGLNSKIDSLVENISVFKYPSCITLQEIKLRKCGTVKLSEYQVFEKVRAGLGGGLLTAIDKNLNPVLIEAINDESVNLVVQCQLGENKV